MNSYFFLNSTFTSNFKSILVILNLLIQKKFLMKNFIDNMKFEIKNLCRSHYNKSEKTLT